MPKVIKSKKVIKKKTKKVVVAKPPEDTLDLHGAKAAAMLYDPCGADLSESVYPGDRGYVNRFVQNLTYAGSTNTCWAIIYKPGNTVAHYTADITSSATAVISYGNVVPGNVFLAANASKARAAGFCSIIRPVAAPNAATGTIHFGVVNAASLPNGLSTTYDKLVAFCTESVSVSQALMSPLEVKWCPGGFDDRYSSIFAGGAGDDDSDRNVLLMVGVGFNTNSGIQMRTTAIYEWVPKTDLGVVSDATSTKSSRCDVSCVLRNLKRKDINWWWNVGKRAADIGKQLVSGYYTGGPVGALGAAAKFL